MCGIAGVMMRGGAAPDPMLLDRLQAALAHRGPDGAGRHVRADTGLVHLRLSIVDLVTGDQPLFLRDGTALIANGEIYNDPDLRARLHNAGYRTGSDCETPLLLYARDGESYADELRGMYAIAIHDPARGRLVLSRDPFGIKPLYYTVTAAGLAFASEPQALIAAGLVEADETPGKRAELLNLKYTRGAATIFPGVMRVLPGETIVVVGGEIVSRRRRPALPDGPPVPIAHEAALRRLDQVLLDSVVAHLRSDVPYGLFLSGGIDSSALLALMRRATGTRVRVLTVGWEGGGAVDESAEAERLARTMGAECHRLAMTERDFWTLAPRIAGAIDDPTTDAAVLPTWILGRAARADGLKVTLCGEGADELLGGYSRYRKQRVPWRWIARTRRTAAAYAIGGRTPMQAVQAADVAEWLPNDLLTKLDRCLMVHGVEGRTPFLDPLVAGFAFRLPDAEKATLRFGKTLLRDWLARAFPEAGAYARKKGFKPPVGAWIAARAATLCELLADHPAIHPVGDRASVRRTLDAAGSDPQPAWSLLFYALWYSRHIMAMDMSGDIAEVLSAARASARP